MQLFLQKYMYIINNQMFITFSPNPKYEICYFRKAKKDSKFVNICVPQIPKLKFYIIVKQCITALGAQVGLISLINAPQFSKKLVFRVGKKSVGIAYSLPSFGMCIGMRDLAMCMQLTMVLLFFADCFPKLSNYNGFWFI